MEYRQLPHGKKDEKFGVLALGMKMDFGRYLEIGERGYTMERWINTRFGVTAANDKLPKRLTDVPQDPKDTKAKIPLETMKKTYYQARGWDQNGIPYEKTLLRLGSGIKELALDAGSIPKVKGALLARSQRITKRDVDGCVILINGKPGKKRSKLEDGDQVVLMSPVAGG